MSANRDIIFHEKDDELRNDVRWLGKLVGDMLRELGGEVLYERVESIRRVAIDARVDTTPSSTNTTAEKLEQLVGGLQDDDALDVVRAFSSYFQVVNLAERVHRIRRARDYARADKSIQPDSIEDTLRDLKRRGITYPTLIQVLNDSLIELVFTAHPTEATRRTILDKQQRIAKRLVERLDPSLTPSELNANTERIRTEVTSGWQTDEHPDVRPSVAYEREHVTFYLTDVIYRVIPPLYESLSNALHNVYPTKQPPPLPTILRFGSWVGGDMDGNPNVSAHTIEQTLQVHKDLIVDRYEHELNTLYEQLSQTLTRASVNEGVLKRIREYRATMPDVFATVSARRADMPYRELISYMRQRLGTGNDAYETLDAFRSDLALIEHSLKTHKGVHAGLFAVERLQRRIATFGFHLATLDVRQDALVHRRTIGHGLNDEDWLSRSANERAQRLVKALTSREPPIGQWSDEDRGVIEVFDTIAVCRERFGVNAIGPYIISMTEGADDVLSVLLLARWSALGTGSDIQLDVVPLLETVGDLERSREIFTDLLSLNIYSRHLAARDQQQMVMLGYSDSNKDSGFTASRHAVYSAQETLNALAQKHAVELTLFHGAGGTRSRGDSQAHKALIMQSKSGAGVRYRITEQGEVIDARYGLRNIAMRTFERSLGAVLRAATQTIETSASSKSTENDICRAIATASRAKYRSLVYESDGFVDFFRQTTPIDVIERLQIGSRPSARRAQAGIEDLRAIPWVFSWTQSRYFLTGWYGLGTGLQHAIAQFGEQTVRDACKNNRFLESLLADAEVTLAKTDLGIAQRYLALVETSLRAYFSTIEAEFSLSVNTILKVIGRDKLLDNAPVMQRSIRLRNPYVDPISLVQVDLLGRWRRGGRQNDETLNTLQATVNGIARGLQSTG